MEVRQGAKAMTPAPIQKPCWECVLCGHVWLCRDIATPPEQCSKCLKRNWGGNTLVVPFRQHPVPEVKTSPKLVGHVFDWKGTAYRVGREGFHSSKPHGGTRGELVFSFIGEPVKRVKSSPVATSQPESKTIHGAFKDRSGATEYTYCGKDCDDVTVVGDDEQGDLSRVTCRTCLKAIHAEAPDGAAPRKSRSAVKSSPVKTNTDFMRQLEQVHGALIPVDPRTCKHTETHFENPGRRKVCSLCGTKMKSSPVTTSQPKRKKSQRTLAGEQRVALIRELKSESVTISRKEKIATKAAYWKRVTTPPTVREAQEENKKVAPAAARSGDPKPVRPAARPKILFDKGSDYPSVREMPEVLDKQIEDWCRNQNIKPEAITKLAQTYIKGGDCWGREEDWDYVATFRLQEIIQRIFRKEIILPPDPDVDTDDHEYTAVYRYVEYQLWDHVAELIQKEVQRIKSKDEKP